MVLRPPRCSISHPPPQEHAALRADAAHGHRHGRASRARWRCPGLVALDAARSPALRRALAAVGLPVPPPVDTSLVVYLFLSLVFLLFLFLLFTVLLLFFIAAAASPLYYGLM